MRRNVCSELYKYMKVRAANEDVEWALTETFLQCQFDMGIRVFFGVMLDSSGKLLADEQRPEFFRAYSAN